MEEHQSLLKPLKYTYNACNLHTNPSILQDSLNDYIWKYKPKLSFPQSNNIPKSEITKCTYSTAPRMISKLSSIPNITNAKCVNLFNCDNENCKDSKDILDHKEISQKLKQYIEEMNLLQSQRRKSEQLKDRYQLLVKSLDNRNSLQEVFNSDIMDTNSKLYHQMQFLKDKCKRLHEDILRKQITKSQAIQHLNKSLIYEHQIGDNQNIGPKNSTIDVIALDKMLENILIEIKECNKSKHNMLPNNLKETMEEIHKLVHLIQTKSSKTSLPNKVPLKNILSNNDMNITSTQIELKTEFEPLEKKSPTYSSFGSSETSLNELLNTTKSNESDITAEKTISITITNSGHLAIITQGPIEIIESKLKSSTSGKILVLTNIRKKSNINITPSETSYDNTEISIIEESEVSGEISENDTVMSLKEQLSEKFSVLHDSRTYTTLLSENSIKEKPILLRSQSDVNIKKPSDIKTLKVCKSNHEKNLKSIYVALLPIEDAGVKQYNTRYIESDKPALDKLLIKCSQNRIVSTSFIDAEGSISLHKIKSDTSQTSKTSNNEYKRIISNKSSKETGLKLSSLTQSQETNKILQISEVNIIKQKPSESVVVCSKKHEFLENLNLLEVHKDLVSNQRNQQPNDHHVIEKVSNEYKGQHVNQGLQDDKYLNTPPNENKVNDLSKCWNQERCNCVLYKYFKSTMDDNIDIENLYLQNQCLLKPAFQREEKMEILKSISSSSSLLSLGTRSAQSVTNKLSIIKIPQFSTELTITNATVKSKFIKSQASHCTDCDCFDCSYKKMKSRSHKSSTKLTKDLQTHYCPEHTKHAENNINHNKLVIRQLKEVIKQTSNVLMKDSIKVKKGTSFEKSDASRRLSSMILTMTGVKLALCTIQNKCNQNDKTCLDIVKELKLEKNKRIQTVTNENTIIEKPILQSFEVDTKDEETSYFTSLPENVEGKEKTFNIYTANIINVPQIPNFVIGIPLHYH